MTVSRYKGRGGVELWRYTFNYTVAGRQRHVEKRGFETKRDAVDAERVARSELRATVGGTIGSGTVGDFLRLWFARYEASGSRKVSTVASVRQHVNVYLIPRLDNVKLRKLTLETVQELANDLHAAGAVDGSGLSAKSVGNVIGTLRKALGDGVKWRQLPYNAAIGVDLPRRTKYEPDAYDDAEVGVLLDYLYRHDDPEVAVVDFALIRLAFATGLRRGELCGLRWRDVDFVGRRITVRSNRIVVHGVALDTDPKSSAGQRTFGFDVDSLDAIARLRNAQEHAYETGGSTVTDDDFVAARLDGRRVHPLTLSRRFQRHALNAGLRRIRLHDTRASHAQSALADGVDPVTVSRRIGHAQVSTTLNVYGRFMPSHDRDAADSIGAKLTDAQVNARTTGRTSSELRPLVAGNDVKSRTTGDLRPLPDIDGTTKHDPTVEATSGIERRYEWSERALY